MGDRFYTQQLAAGKGCKKGELPKMPRRMKKDIIEEFNKLVGKEVSGLDKLTMSTLNSMLEIVDDAISAAYNKGYIDRQDGENAAESG